MALINSQFAQLDAATSGETMSNYTSGQQVIPGQAYNDSNDESQSDGGGDSGVSADDAGSEGQEVSTDGVSSASEPSSNPLAATQGKENKGQTDKSKLLGKNQVRVEESEEDGEEGTLEAIRAARDGQQLTPKPKAGVVSRDYSDIAPEDVDIFKHMSNKGFDKLKPLYKEHKILTEKAKAQEAKIKELEASGGKAGVIDHPESYVLSPEYKQAISEQQIAAAKVTHWKKQFAASKSGDQVRGLAWDEAGKQWVLTDAVDTTPEIEAEILSQLQNANAELGQITGQVKGMGESYKKSYEGDVKLIKDFENESFKDYDKPEHPMHGTVSAIMAEIPARFRSHPVASLLAKTATMNIQLQKALAEMSKKISVKQAVVTDRRKAGPNGSDVQQTGNVGNKGKGNGEGSFSLEDFRRARDM